MVSEGQQAVSCLRKSLVQRHVANEADLQQQQPSRQYESKTSELHQSITHAIVVLFMGCRRPRVV